MAPLVEVRLQGLARCLEQRRGIPEKRDADECGPAVAGTRIFRFLSSSESSPLAGFWMVNPPIGARLSKNLYLVRVRILQPLDIPE